MTEIKNQLRYFCECLLALDEDFVQRIIWTDEKFFVLHQKWPWKNDSNLSRETFHEIIESNDINEKNILLPLWKQRFYWFMRSLIEWRAEFLWIVIATSNCCKIRFSHFFFVCSNTKKSLADAGLSSNALLQRDKAFRERKISRKSHQQRDRNCLAGAQTRVNLFARVF